MIKISPNTKIDLDKLIATRMLINTNSGGGKSWAIRRFLEQSYGQVQQIIIDLEGEFSTLREKFDYLLVGKEGEIPTHIRTAELLAKKLLELNVSTIVDLSELRHPERITFVKRFLDSLINSPKNLWHRVIVVVDEAHQFCPEKAKSEAALSVIDLMTRGRKRKFCGILATQRISKLNKDAAAEANNYMIGRTGLDIDMKRASELLGFTSKDEMRGLRDLKAGEFHAFGPAFDHNGVKKIVVGSVQTTHDTVEAHTKGPVKTPANIKRILKDLVDLPKEAEEELHNLQDYKNKVRELKTKLAIAGRGKPQIDERAVERAREMGLKQGYAEASKESIKLEKAIRIFEKKISDIARIVEVSVQKQEGKPTKVNPAFSVLPKIKVRPYIPQTVIGSDSEIPLRAGAVRMLNWLAGAQMLTKQRLATLAGFSIKGGTFNTYISELKRNGWIVGDEELSITEEGLKNASPEPIPTGEELLVMWMGKFRAGVGKILRYLYEQHPNSCNKDEVGYALDFEPTGGTFNTYLSELRRNGLIQIENNSVVISNEFFE